jgi:hypothetical protein
MIIDENNRIVAGERFDLSPERVIEICDAERRKDLLEGAPGWWSTISDVVVYDQR